MRYTPQEKLDLYYLARNASLRFSLDSYEVEVIKRVDTLLGEMHKEFSGRLNRYAAKSYTRQRMENILLEVEILNAATKLRITDTVAEASGVAGSFALGEHSDILSVGGKAVNVQGVNMSSVEFGALFLTSQLGGAGGQGGGYNLQGWVDRALGESQQLIVDGIQKGMFLGEGYPSIIRRVLGDCENLSKQEAITLVRTYVQSANVSAQEAVYAKNADILRSEEWCSVLEPGYKQTGRGTCLRCSSLDGRIWALDEAKPPCPLHPRCRCCLLPVVDWAKIGIPEFDLDEAVRPYTIRPDQNIDGGGTRAILDGGHHQGSYADWFKGRDEQFKLNVLGPNRYELYKNGVSFESFVDNKTGELYTLKELHGNPSMFKFQPTRSIAHAEFQAKRLGVNASLDGLPLETAQGLTASLAEAHTKGFHVPSRVGFSRGTFEKSPDVGASYSRKLDMLELNPNFDYNTLTERTKKHYEKGYCSTSSPLHVFRHEIGHGTNAANNPKRYAILSDEAHYNGLPLRGEIAELVRSEVSRYAAWSPLELVAEVYAGLMDGREYSNKIMTLYKAYGGVWK